MRRYFMMMAAALVCVMAAYARTVVVDNEGELMVGAVVMNSDGTPIGIVTADGLLPEVAPANYPLTLKSMGCEPTLVSAPVDTVVMLPASYEMKEVVVKPGDRPACHVVCYIREVSGINNGVDTMRMVANYMADYMIPAFDGAKKIVTWDSPRILNKQSDVYINTRKKMDPSDSQLLEWAKTMAKLPKKSIVLPDSLRGRTCAWTRDANKTVKWQQSPSGLTMIGDPLITQKDHTWTPGIMKMFGMTCDFTELLERTNYAYAPNGHYDITNFTARSFSMKILGRGKIFHLIFDDKRPVDIYTYIEIYPVAIEFLTPDEAKAVKKETKSYPMTIPDAAK